MQADATGSYVLQTGSEIELNEHFKRALELMEHSDRSVFITGRAGTGKSTLLACFRETTGKRVAILAPTGVAALNVKGQTIHSFFGFKPNITPDAVRQVRSRSSRNVYMNLDAIVIDEVSMVRADLLDCVERFLRLNGPEADKPFGGIQMIFIGDLYQLPPVIAGAEKTVFRSLYESPYFYSARAFGSLDMELVELEKVYRQHDQQFIDLLNSIRNNSITERGVELLNSRYMPDFEPSGDDFYVYLTTTNAQADVVNNSELAKLDGPSYAFTARLEGEFGKEYLPTAVELEVKVGAQVMMLNNDADGRWVNGSIGKITDIVRYRGDYIIVAELTDGEEVEIAPYTWEIFRYFADASELRSEVVGRFTQYPLMLAWAITIHKSQGKTFDRVVIDIGKGTFAHGQTYVALSRCTTLEGMVLKRPILKKHIWTDYKVMKFLTGYQYSKAERARPVDMKIEAIRKAIDNDTLLEITYLKPNDEKSRRTVRPVAVGEMEYSGKSYLGMQAFCLKRNEDRVFRVDRILEMREL
jgi:ATP-dependent exoDNAse (exonuclease V) alpha subunit